MTPEPVAPIRTFRAGRLGVRVDPDREAMGRAAALAAAESLRARLSRQDAVRVIFAAAPSQDEFLDALIDAEGVDWRRVHAFHMDEYLDLPAEAPQRFAAFLRARLFDRLPFGAVHTLDPAPADPEAACARYTALLSAAPIDLVCLGIGENGHLAFNDPPVADFDDPADVKVVALDDACRRQQVHDGCFATLEAVPRRAVTLTIPALLRARQLSVVVPGPTKANAVRAALLGPIEPRCPASVLRRHERATLYLDPDAAALLPP